jgi:hypothetical protein
MSDTNSLTFDQALAKFIGATKNSQEYALMCSTMALAHFAAHGDVTYVQRFHDAIPKNYGRQAAFVIWACDFAPIKMEQKLFKKDHDRAENGENGAIKNVDMTGAAAKPYWDYVPEKPIMTYAKNDVIAQLKRVTGRFRNTDKYRPDSEADVAFLAAVDSKIGELERLATATPAGNA